MGLQASTAPCLVDLPVVLDDLKTNLRIVNDLVDANEVPYSSDDAALSAILLASINHIEIETRQQLCTQQYLLTADGFPNDPTCRARESYSFDRVHFERFIKLPKPPLQSVESIQYIDVTGTLQTLDPSTYTVDNTARPGRIVLNPTCDWPQTNRSANSVRVNFTAGYGDAYAVPPILRQAIMLLAGSWYENRENDITLRINSIPIGVQSIIASAMFPECEG